MSRVRSFRSFADLKMIPICSDVNLKCFQRSELWNCTSRPERSNKTQSSISSSCLETLLWHKIWNRAFVLEQFLKTTHVKGCGQYSLNPRRLKTWVQNINLYIVSLVKPNCQWRCIFLGWMVLHSIEDLSSKTFACSAFKYNWQNTKNMDHKHILCAKYLSFKFQVTMGQTWFWGIR